MRRKIGTVILVSTLLAAPLTLLSMYAVYMPPPMYWLAMLFGAPMLLLDYLTPDHPTWLPSTSARWVIFIAGQLVWFWILGLLVVELRGLLVGWRRRG